MDEMTAQQIFLGERVAHVRELKTEVTRLTDELARARAELAEFRSHFALALAAARDADRLPAGGRLLVVDGWNALLGGVTVLAPGERHLPSREKAARLRVCVRAWLDRHPQDAAWIVFDGAEAGGRAEPRLHVTYTGGAGLHRADRLVCDYLRMRRLVGAAHDVLVLTEDKDFRREAAALGAAVAGVAALRASAD